MTVTTNNAAGNDVVHKMALDAIGLAAKVLTPQAEYLGLLVQQEAAMHSYMHITDPTFYQKAIHSRELAQQVRLARAALAFILEVQAVKAELTGGTP